MNRTSRTTKPMGRLGEVCLPGVAFAAVLFAAAWRLQSRRPRGRIAGDHVGTRTMDVVRHRPPTHEVEDQLTALPHHQLIPIKHRILVNGEDHPVTLRCGDHLPGRTPRSSQVKLVRNGTAAEHQQRTSGP